MVEEEDDDDVIVDDEYLLEDEDNDVQEVSCIHEKNKGGRPQGVQIQSNAFVNEGPMHGDSTNDDLEGEIVYDSEEILNSCDESSEEDEDGRNIEFDSETMMNDPHFEVEMTFGTFEDFKKAVRNWSIKKRYEV